MDCRPDRMTGIVHVKTAKPLIRPASDDDIAAIAALYAQEVRAGTATYEYEAPDAEEMLRRMRDVLAAGYPWLVAELDGAFAGYAYAGGYRARIGYRWTVESTVYVAPRLHGRGIGTALMTALIGECEARGFRQMIAVIGEPANRGSIALHERLGFRTVATFEGAGRKHGRWLDTVFMQRALGSGSTEPPGES